MRRRVDIFSGLYKKSHIVWVYPLNKYGVTRSGQQKNRNYSWILNGFDPSLISIEEAIKHLRKLYGS